VDPKLPLLVVTTVATREQALALARDLVERRLAACAQVSAIDSIYRWQGAVEQAPEFRLLLKTHAGGYAALEAALRAQHPYDLPAIHAIATVQAHAAYAEWVRACTRAEPGAD
jgi:periplasmic divalent cation tolerance protein